MGQRLFNVGQETVLVMPDKDMGKDTATRQYVHTFHVQHVLSFRRKTEEGFKELDTEEFMQNTTLKDV